MEMMRPRLSPGPLGSEHRVVASRWGPLPCPLSPVPSPRPYFFAAFFAPLATFLGWLIWAWAAARRAIGTRNGEQLT